jgi:UDP-GlcNAc:undecaprenyl-phosphate GlcNAc-1-phosphate transferase
MPHLTTIAIALVLSMMLVPLSMRLAPMLGLMDQPDARKVHAKSIPRVGGIGIVIGALAGVLFWMPPEPLYWSFIFGTLVLFLFGLLDDRYETGHYTKFVGQFIAAGLVVFYGGLYVERMPFLAPRLVEPWLGQVFTLFALVGLINAANHSDGLDGLAGGLTLMTLVAVAVLASQAGGTEAVLLSLAVMGSVLGFLRFNTHPASVFMGDSGSQFLGFASGFLVVLLTQHVNPALSPAIVALLLGLPVVDILAVFYLRASAGMNWFRATRNHVHHRLLDLGLSHQTTVVAIYGIQLLFICSAFPLRYQSDASILLVYGLIVAALFAGLVWLERGAGSGSVGALVGKANSAVSLLRRTRLLDRGPIFLLAVLVPLYMLSTAMTVSTVPSDFGLLSVILLLVGSTILLFARRERSDVTATVVFAAGVFCVYLCANNPPAVIPDLPLVRKVFFALLAATVLLSLKFAMDAGFRTTTMDYLAVSLVILVSIFPMPEVLGGQLAAVAVKVILLFYACEILLTCGAVIGATLVGASAVTLGILALRGFGVF